MNHKNFRIKILGFFSSLWRESERYVVFSSQEWKKKKGKSILGALRASNWLFMVVVVLMTMAIFSENIRFWHSVITRPFASGFTRRRFGLRIIYPKKKEIRIKITRHKCLKTNALPRGSTNAKFSIMAIMIKKPNKL
ncbi:BnaAnng13990D [Brassica napus]|uniref:BnaAnng13990D protein n=1 Tax=Brassica napus TaxID=3708 RepID=A0A078J1R2_BRANA|nr:BnaAnng13990D [Brassica napus]